MLELRGISKSFPGVRALRELSLEFRPGEIHALMGENGAGKSTAIKILTGIYQPDEGEIWHDGQRVVLASYRDALERGIGIVHQEIQIIPDASVAENVLLDRLPTGRFGLIDWPEAERRAAESMQLVGLTVAPEAPARTLSVAQKQLLQIAKALGAKVRILLLDEPTSCLSEHEAERLFAVLRRLRDSGVAIIFVSHKLEEVFALCDRVSVLRDGALIGTRGMQELTRGELVTMMIGRECNDDHVGPLSPNWSEPVLRVEHLVRRGKVDDVSFTLHRGEVLGFYGLIGAGRTELARVLIGEDNPDAGTVWLRGKAVHISNVGEAISRHRLGYVTENRKEEGLFLHDSVENNLTLAVLKKLINPWTRCIRSAATTDLAGRLADSLQIKTPSLETPVGLLSGGNQQKVSIGKWLAADCEILIVDEPTIGVDVGAKAQIHQLIWELAARHGKSVIVISSDLPELVRLVNRLLVFREHRIVGEVTEIDAQRKSYADVSREIAPCFA